MATPFLFLLGQILHTPTPENTVIFEITTSKPHAITTVGLLYHSFRNHDIVNLKTFKSRNCDRRKLLRIPEGNSARKQGNCNCNAK